MHTNTFTSMPNPNPLVLTLFGVVHQIAYLGDYRHWLARPQWPQEKEDIQVTEVPILEVEGNPPTLMPQDLSLLAWHPSADRFPRLPDEGEVPVWQQSSCVFCRTWWVETKEEGEKRRRTPTAVHVPCPECWKEDRDQGISLRHALGVTGRLTDPQDLALVRNRLVTREWDAYTETVIYTPARLGGHAGRIVATVEVPWHE